LAQGNPQVFPLPKPESIKGYSHFQPTPKAGDGAYQQGLHRPDQLPGYAVKSDGTTKPSVRPFIEKNGYVYAPNTRNGRCNLFRQPSGQVIAAFSFEMATGTGKTLTPPLSLTLSSHRQRSSRAVFGGSAGTEDQPTSF